MELNDLLASQFVLPSIPQVVALLLSELEQNEPNLMKISQLISTDLALTTRLLQTANSGYFKLSGKINSVSESLAILGLNHVHSMAMAAASSVSFKAVAGINLQQFWVYSLNVAKLSRSLAGVVRQNQQAAFTCGLIHAVGELAMHMGMPEELKLLDRDTPALDLRRAHVENSAFGFCYAQVGAGLARQWHFPQPIVEALDHQDAPFENDVYEPLAGVIHLATWRARAEEAHLPDKALAVTFPGSVGEVLELDIDMVLQQDPFDWFAQGPDYQTL
jgi:HD-like signal output (HDOD) protein